MDRENTWTCPNCGNVHTFDALFCPVCGTKRPEELEEEPEPEPEPDIIINDEPDEDVTDLTMDNPVMFLTQEEAANGCRKELLLPDGRDAFINLPGGIEENSRLKLNNIMDLEDVRRDIVIDIVIR